MSVTHSAAKLLELLLQIGIKNEVRLGGESKKLLDDGLAVDDLGKRFDSGVEFGARVVIALFGQRRTQFGD